MQRNAGSGQKENPDVAAREEARVIVTKMKSRVAAFNKSFNSGSPKKTPHGMKDLNMMF